jgi:phospholipid/cholesterol/gamma-HCH transport system substrate-binding protein
MSKEVKIGTFAVIVLVASFFLINYLRGEDLFNREIEVSSRFETVEGLAASAPVFIKGYKAGKVSEVSYDSEKDDFEVVCSVVKEFLIPADSRMTIFSTDIMGGKGIRIDFGTSAEYINDGDELLPAFEKGLMDGLAEGVMPLLEKVNNTIDSLNVTVSGINSFLSAENINTLGSTLKHIDATMANLRGISSSVNGKSKEIETLMDNLATISGKFTHTADKLDTTIAGVGTIVQSVNEADIVGLVQSFRQLLENINDPDGSIGKLLTDDSVYNSVDELLSDVDELVKKIQENPKKYIKISVF